MKKTLSIFMIGLLSLSYAGTVTPTISLRFDDIMSATDAMETATPIVGLKMSLDDGVYTGFDATAVSSRIYIEKSFGKLGLGTYTAAVQDGAQIGEPYFTAGATYGVMDNLNLELEYVVNSWATSTADVLNLSLTINF